MKNKVTKISKRIIKSELVKGAFFLFTGFIAANLFYFLLNLFLARNLSTSDYGIYASLLSLLTLASVPSSALAPIIVKFAGGYFANEEHQKASILYKTLLKYLILLSALLLIVFILLSAYIENFLMISNGYYILIVSMVIFISYISILNNAFLQSMLKFKFLSLLSFSGGIIRLLVAIALVTIGYKVYGALWAIFIAGLAPFILGFIPLSFLKIKNKNKVEIYPLKEIAKYAIPAAVAVFSLTSFISTDVILVKHYFNPTEAGFYGGISLIARIIFYLTVPISTVMFSIVVKRHSKGEDFSNIFYLAMFLVVIPSFLLVSIYFLFPDFVIRFFLGGEYLSQSIYLGFFGVFLALYSILSVFTNFYLSMNKTFVSVPLLLGALTQVVLITLFHQSFFQIIGVSILTSGILTLFFFIYFVSKNLSSLKNISL